jgi:biopolymer transport protein ExbD
MKKKKRAPDDNDGMALQITSMADIFTIILVFLLKSFATSAIPLAPGVHLPHAKSTDAQPYKESVTIEIQSEHLLLDQKSILSLRQFFSEASPAQLLNSSQTQISAILLPALKQIKAEADSHKDLSQITVLADEYVPYITLQEVMRVASLAGFRFCQLVMVKDAS